MRAILLHCIPLLISGPLAAQRDSTSTDTLKPSVAVLGEVVVTAYGTTRKTAYTGTAAVIDADRFRDLQVSSIANVLQGTASGVWVTNATGQPGENPDVRIRGIGSVNAIADPTIILDGAPYGGNLNSINPRDIESITILKDASSTTLYGSRAANGIIQIITRTGKGTARVSISAVHGRSRPAVSDYQYLDPAQQYELTWEALRNQATISPGLAAAIGAASAEEYASRSVTGVLVYNPFRLAEPVGRDGRLIPGTKELWNEDWAKALLRTGQRSDLDISVAGGNDKTRYFISAGMLEDQGAVIESKFNRYTGRAKVDTRVNEWLNMGVNFHLSYSTQNYPVQGGTGYTNVTGWIRSVPGIYPLYLRDPLTGSFIPDAAGKPQFDFGNNGPLHRPILTPENPAATVSLNPNTYDRYTTSVNAFADARILPGLHFRLQYATDIYENHYSQYYNPFVGSGAAYGGRSEKIETQNITQTFINTINYDRQVGRLHHLNMVTGTEAYKYHQGIVDAASRGFTSPGTTELVYGSVAAIADSYAADNRTFSYFSRVNYDLDNKYHISASYRRDASSRFADPARWGSFWSIGMAWNIIPGNALKDTGVVNDCKLRGSYGTTGNQQLRDLNGRPAYFPYLATYAAGADIADNAGSSIANPYMGALTWETQKTLDLGLDFTLLNRRLSGSFTWFTRQSSGLLFNRPMAPSSGLDGVNDNVGSVGNRGFEIDCRSINVKKKIFQWSTTIHFSRVGNTITQLPQQSITGHNYDNLIVGQTLNNFHIRDYAGVDGTNGRPLWYKDQIDPQGKVLGRTVTSTWNEATLYYKGSSMPDWTGGITNDIRYKGWELSVLAYINYRGKVYDATYAGQMTGSIGNTPGRAWSKDILGRWQRPDKPGDGRTPRLTMTTDDQASAVSTRFLFDDTYLRIRNITLGYNIPGPPFKGARARIFIDLQNPFTFYNRKGPDPEEGGLTGITNNGSRVCKTFSAGLDASF